MSDQFFNNSCKRDFPQVYSALFLIESRVSDLAMRSIEKIVFEKFIANRPDFAGRPVSWEEGDDPPDVLCKDGEGKRIGVELAEWLNEKQIQASKQRESIEVSYEEALESKQTTPPTNVGLVWLSRKEEIRLSRADYVQFRDEMYDLIQEIDKTLKPSNT